MGGPQCGTQLIYELTETNTQNTNDVTTLLANRDNARVVFDGHGSTFNSLRVSTDNGVILKADVTSTGGSAALASAMRVWVVAHLVDMWHGLSDVNVA